METLSFRIPELDCSEECSLIKKAFSKHKGIEKLDFDVLSQTAEVTYDPTKIDAKKIEAILRSTGMQIFPKEGAPLSFWQRRGRLILSAASGIFWLIGLILHLIGPTSFGDIGGFTPHYEHLPWPVLSFYILAIVAGGWFVFPKAIKSAKALHLDIHILMVIAVFGSMAIGQWFEGATVTFLFAVALLLESWSVEKARKAIGALLDLSPKRAKVLVDGKVVEKGIEEVAVGDRVMVAPGERIPLDGVVVKGSSTVNQAPITGESIPVEKGKGDSLFAGTINEEGGLTFEVTKKMEESTLSRIIQMVQEARKKRAKSEQWVDRFARVYTPIMLGLATLFAIVPPLVFGLPWIDGIYRGLVLLVIACPCALVISTPVSIVSALTRSAKSGALIKGGAYLEVMGKLKTIAFDKTGTITQGKPRVQKIVPLNTKSEKELLAIAASMEAQSEHPIARAILQRAAESQVSFTPAEDFQSFKGLGAEGTIDGKRYWIGSHRFMHEKRRAETQEAHEAAVALEDAGHSVVAIGDFTHICGLISVADEPRPLVREVISSLKGLGLKQTVMLTGDNMKTAANLAGKIGIGHYFAELMPEDKVGKIEELKKSGFPIAMVGDGVNDAPAMATSSLGIAMGAMGTDAAFETADIVLMRDDLTLLPFLVRHARRTLNIIKQNIWFALGVKALFILLALFGWATLWMAIGADTGASLLVVFNGLRLLNKQ